MPLRCKQTVNEALLTALRLPMKPQICYTVCITETGGRVIMSSRSRRKQDIKKLLVRIISLALAVLMVLSVVMAYVWRW